MQYVFWKLKAIPAIINTQYLCAFGGWRVLDDVVNDRWAVGDAEQRES